MDRSILENDYYIVSLRVDTLAMATGNLERHLIDKSLTELLSGLVVMQGCADDLADFLSKYDAFLESVDSKFGLQTQDRVRLLKQKNNEICQSIEEMRIMLSQSRFSDADAVSKQLSEKGEDVKSLFGALAVVLASMDYSRLEAADLKKIGVAGIHYRSRVFLSYPYRNSDPRRDTNQQMIDNLVKPMFDLVNIEPVTLRDKMKSQDSIDDRAIELIKDCNGIVAFFTKRDDISNVEHELSKNESVIAICVEKGAKCPSMRSDRLQIRFDRKRIEGLLMDLLQALKDKQMYRLRIE